eukprot:Transcript_8347.p1 GENE.Transcript_8347~~Transcript_8347.p1  ORF type:complete len:428 (-),score=139.03 Transcript_8347:221-1504(-)
MSVYMSLVAAATLALVHRPDLLPRATPRHECPRCSFADDFFQEARLVRGSTALVEQPVFFDSTDGAAPFDVERWQTHRSNSRYAFLLPGILVGATTKRISAVVAGLVVFSALVGVYNDQAAGGSETALGFLPIVQLPLTPFELTAPVLGLLLVFRTDTANGRFNDGCSAVWEISSALRSLVRKLVAWTGSEKSTDAERAAALDLIDATLLLHGWIMGSYLRGKPLKAAQEAQLLRFAKGFSAKPSARSGEAQASRGRGDFLRDEFVPSTPYLAITAISLGVAKRLPSLTDQELVGIDEELGKVDAALGKCEKLLRAPIPLGYTRYSVRFLFLWLTLLPFALSSTFQEFGAGTWWEDKPQPVLAFAMLFVGFVFLSIEDIAVQIEEPFSILPLVKCHKWLLFEVRRMKSLVSLPDAERRGRGSHRSSE